MAQTFQFKVLVVIKEKSGASKTIYPIIEASSVTEAIQIAKAQFPNGDVRNASKIN